MVFVALGLTLSVEYGFSCEYTYMLVTLYVKSIFPGSHISQEFIIPRNSHFPGSQTFREVTFPEKSHFLARHSSRFFCHIIDNFYSRKISNVLKLTKYPIWPYIQWPYNRYLLHLLLGWVQALLTMHSSKFQASSSKFQASFKLGFHATSFSTSVFEHHLHPQNC